ncbi:putative colanic acid biosynthesis UDP-glucose lipid carrier transferase [Larkinella arboricola]|uniref:Putative colanic acid biosynthesis UDP-glucose lipid carrier transferase n=2 Tax=Larkinella arboricola TaxID=643671 RepID=A0A327X6B9_LARAB|nr:putative colanic acid biosynthesis UDP-glucose lipid carrier transferase [Larkinella arboricola]
MINLLQPNSSYYVVRETTARKPQPMVKRCFDLIVSLLVTAFILSWLLPLIGFLIRLESKGPILFVQLRSGINGRPFPCLKFRTMKHQKNASFKQATQNDVRVTRIGRILRKTNLDELPQVLNVIAGHMSIVGPRPHPIPLDIQYLPLIPEYRERFRTKPGITGLAQAKGLRGETSELNQMRHRVRYDIWYTKYSSLLLDIKICWWTVEKMIKGDKNAW